MDLQIFLRMILRHKWMIILLCLSATIAAQLITYLVSEKYEATTLVLVRPHQEIGISSRKDRALLNFPVTGGATFPETPSKTSIAIIKSRAIAERVVRKLRLDEKEQQLRQTENKNAIERFKNLARNLGQSTTQILKYGRVIGKRSPFEQAVVNFQDGISLQATKETYTFDIMYESEDPEESASTANQSAEVFLEYMVENNKLQALGTQKTIAKRFHESENELIEARRALHQFKAVNKITSLEKETAEKIKLLSELESALEQTQTKLSGLLRQYTAEHPKSQAAEAEKAHLLGVIAQRKQQLKTFPDAERQLAALTLNVEIAETTYKLLQNEYEQATMRLASQTGEFLIVSYAAPPRYPSKPVRIKFTSTAFAMSLLFGIGLAFFLEGRNTTVRSMEQAERL